MSTLVVGDVHGCADELRALLEATRPDDVVFVGDLFTKGPDPVGVFELVRPWRAVLGNHDARLLDVVDGVRKRDPQAKRVVRTLDAGAKKWKRWLRALPLTLEVGGFDVVHACLHPCGKKTGRQMALYQRRYPDKPGAMRWWSDYRGERPVIFGHDAVRGLVRVTREGRPWAIGLDSGCVYGGYLSGYLLEEDRVIQIRAGQSYSAVD